MKFVTRLAATLVALHGVGVSANSIVDTDVGHIIQIQAYDGHLDTEFVIQFDTGVQECLDGVYLMPMAPGFDSMRTLALTALAAEKPIYFQVYLDRLLNGYQTYCEVETVQVHNSQLESTLLNYDFLRETFREAMEEVIINVGSPGSQQSSVGQQSSQGTVGAKDSQGQIGLQGSVGFQEVAKTPLLVPTAQSLSISIGSQSAQGAGRLLAQTLAVPASITASGDWSTDEYNLIYSTFVCPPPTWGNYPLEWNSEETLTPMHFINKLPKPAIAPPSSICDNVACMLERTQQNHKNHNYKLAARPLIAEILPGVKTPVFGIGVPGYPKTFGSPGPTIIGKPGEAITVEWVNELVDHEGRYVKHLLSSVLDRALDWANPTCDRPFPFHNEEEYKGPVPISIHLHGGHQNEESDGHPNAWWMPDAHPFPPNHARNGHLYSYFKEKSSVGNRWTHGSQVSEYSERRPVRLWYHDHTMGITRLNVYAGLLGLFYFEGGTFDISNLPSGKFQMPLVFQDKSFNADGTLFFPDHQQQAGLDIPYSGEATCNGGGPSDVPRHWQPAFFGDVQTVNGKAWPIMDVAAGCYRFDVLIGSIFQAYRIELRRSDDTKLPFTVFAGDQGFLRKSAELTSVELFPPERVSILVDFSKFETGDTIDLVNNYVCVGTESPKQPGMLPLSKMFHQMRFRVNRDMESYGDCPQLSELDPRLEELSPNVITGDHVRQRDLSVHVFNSSSVITERSGGTTSGGQTVEISEVCDIDLSLYAGNEIINQTPALISASLATIYKFGSLGMPRIFSDPITEYPIRGEEELWNWKNNSPNAHPIHVHLTPFKIGDRTYCNPQNDTCIKLKPRPWENGPKDTFALYPYSTGSIEVLFDEIGTFMYHCHVLTHEDHSMMRPFCVTNSNGDLPGSCFLHGVSHCDAPFAKP